MVVNARSREAQFEHKTPYETHRTILQAFPEQIPENERVLFRREEQKSPPGLYILIQSVTEPNWSKLENRSADYFLEPPTIRPYPLVGSPGEKFVFRLVANPIVKRDGRRVGLLNEDAQWNWMLRKAEASGFSCFREDVRITQHGFEHSQKRRVSHLRVQYDGILKVERTDLFRDAVCSGIGPAKGYGFGLLSIARLHHLTS